MIQKSVQYYYKLKRALWPHNRPANRILQLLKYPMSQQLTPATKYSLINLIPHLERANKPYTLAIQGYGKSKHCKSIRKKAHFKLTSLTLTRL